MQQDLDEKKGINDISLRNSYTAKFKENAIRLVQTYGVNYVSSSVGISESCLRRWIKHGCERKEGSGRRSFFEDLERELHEWFLGQRKDSRQVSVALLKKQAIKIYESNYKNQDTERNFTASEGWIRNFRIRWNIVYETRTHIQSKLPKDFDVKRDEFLKEIEKYILKHNYPADAIVNMDETPIYYDNPRKKNLEKKVNYLL